MLKTNKIWQKDHSVYNTVSLKNIIYLTNLTQHCKRYATAAHPNTNSLHKFSRKHVSSWCQEKDLHCIISNSPKTAFSKHWERICLYIPVYLHKKTLSQRRRKLSSGGGWIISLRWIVFGARKMSLKFSF